MTDTDKIERMLAGAHPRSGVVRADRRSSRSAIRSAGGARRTRTRRRRAPCASTAGRSSRGARRCRRRGARECGPCHGYPPGERPGCQHCIAHAADWEEAKPPAGLLANLYRARQRVSRSAMIERRNARVRRALRRRPRVKAARVRVLLGVSSVFYELDTPGAAPDLRVTASVGWGSDHFSAASQRGLAWFQSRTRATDHRLRAVRHAGRDLAHPSAGLPVMTAPLDARASWTRSTLDHRVRARGQLLRRARPDAAR